MAKLTLKNLLLKNMEIGELIRSWVGEWNSPVWIEDIKGQTLFGEPSENYPRTFAIGTEIETLGYVRGEDGAEKIASLLNLLVAKEEEKKRLGTEVLNLYQEINLIFDFSEKLAETIDPLSIAEMALEQSRHIIHCDSGMVILMDEKTDSIQELASFGPPILDIRLLAEPDNWLSRKLRRGQSEIISDPERLSSLGPDRDPIGVLLFAPLKVKHQVMGAFFLASKEAVAYPAADLKLLTTLSLQSSAAIDSALLYEKNLKEVKDREDALRRIHEVTKKFVPHEFIRSLGKNTLTDVKLGDQVEKDVTVLFTDIRNYTTIAEKMTPDGNFRFISAFNELMGPIIRQNDGFILQYLGDAIMAIFPQDPYGALNAAVHMQKALTQFNLENQARNLPVIQTGIGMHSGPLIMGITGDEYRLDAATISDTVNTASRIESLTKYYRTTILLTGTTLKLLPDTREFHIRHLGRVQVKGKSEPVSIFECFSGYPDEELYKRAHTLQDFDEAMGYYQERKFEKAESIFRHITEICPSDQTARLFHDKAALLARSGVPENWSGVEEMLSK